MEIKFLYKNKLKIKAQYFYQNGTLINTCSMSRVCNKYVTLNPNNLNSLMLPFLCRLDYVFSNHTY